jgi:hypothetical protein
MKDVNMSNLKIQEPILDCFDCVSTARFLLRKDSLQYGRLSGKRLERVLSDLEIAYPSFPTGKELKNHISRLIADTFILPCSDMVLNLFSYGILYTHRNLDNAIDAFYSRDMQHAFVNSDAFTAFHWTAVAESVEASVPPNNATYAVKEKHKEERFALLHKHFPQKTMRSVDTGTTRWLQEDRFSLVQLYWWHVMTEKHRKME